MDSTILPVIAFGVIIISGFVLITIGTIDSIIVGKEIEQACEDINMEYHYAMDTEFCVDVSGNAHYVKFNCDGFLWNKECTARIISIGEVRVR